ncbi:hypothetical protein GCM10009863_12520 [Streptomyces axinellae]|uniref:Transposase n=1 Tax=Streptomyces axinellae TaxID=552788 RepID=A0ABP6C3I9_9ACTN
MSIGDAGPAAVGGSASPSAYGYRAAARKDPPSPNRLSRSAAAAKVALLLPETLTDWRQLPVTTDGSQAAGWICRGIAW